MDLISLFPHRGQSIDEQLTLMSKIFNSFLLNWYQVFTPKSQIGHFLFLVPTNL